MSADESGIVVPIGEDYPEIREAVRRICADFPGRYWRDLEAAEAYPTDFVKALTEAGYLSVLIPADYGGSGLPLRAASVILEEIHASGCNAGACHAQMYIMGTLLRHGSAEQKRKYLPGIAAGRLRLQAFGVTEPTSGTDTTKLKTRAERRGNSTYVVTGQKVWTSRALHSDLMLLLARTTPLDQVKRKSDGLSVFLVDIKASLGKGLEIKPLKAMINHNTTEVFFDGMEVPAENLIGEEGRGFRYILDGMNAERVLIHQDRLALCQRARGVRPSHRPEPGHSVPDRPRLCGDRGRGPDGAQGGGAVPGRQALRRRSEHGEDAGLGSLLARRRGGAADSWRLRLRQGVRRRAQVARDTPHADRAHLHQPDPGLSGRARA